MKRQFKKLAAAVLILLCDVGDIRAGDTFDSLHKAAKESYRKGSFEQAAQLWENNLNMADAGPERLHTLLNLIKSYQALAYYPKAQALVQKALSDGNMPPADEALLLSAAGDLYLSIGNAGQAAAYLEKAEDLAIRSRNSFVLASVLNNMGNASAASGKDSDALAAFQECLKLMESASDQPDDRDYLKMSATVNSVRLLLKREDYPGLIKMTDIAFRHLMSMDDVYDKSAGLISLSLLIQHAMAAPNFSGNQDARNDIRQMAIDGLRKAISIAMKIQNFRAAGYAYGYLSRLYEEERRYEEAIYLTRNAVFYSQNFPEILYLWQWQLGRIQKEQGQTESAISSFQKAVNTLNPVRTMFFKGYRSQRDIFNEKIKPVYLGLTDLLLKQAEGLPEGSSRQEKLTLARDTMELLKTVELQEFYQDECVTDRRSAKPFAVEASDAIIYPVIFPDRVVMLVSLTSGMKQFVSVADAKTIEDAVRRFRMRLQFSTNDLYLADSEQLYNWLIRPLESILETSAADTLIIAPDGVLRMIPFSALYDGSRFVIEKYAVATVPALALTEPDARRPDQVRILLDGLSVARHGFAALPNVDRELKDIQNIVQGKILQDEDYTLKNLKQEFIARDYAFVHIATHGVFGGNPEDTYLLTHDSRLTMDQLEQLIDQNRRRGNQVELLTLSACETAVGDERSAFGLAGIAVKSGVVSAIATLWFVDDAATSQTMAEFYHQMQTPGITKAKALQNAQKKLLFNPDYNHPAYWAPFLLIGNWR